MKSKYSGIITLLVIIFILALIRKITESEDYKSVSKDKRPTISPEKATQLESSRMQPDVRSSSRKLEMRSSSGKLQVGGSKKKRQIKSLKPRTKTIAPELQSQSRVPGEIPQPIVSGKVPPTLSKDESQRMISKKKSQKRMSKNKQRAIPSQPVILKEESSPKSYYDDLLPPLDTGDAKSVHNVVRVIKEDIQSHIISLPEVERHLRFLIETILFHYDKYGPDLTGQTLQKLIFNFEKIQSHIKVSENGVKAVCQILILYFENLIPVIRKFAVEYDYILMQEKYGIKPEYNDKLLPNVKKAISAQTFQQKVCSFLNSVVDALTKDFTK